MPPISLVNGSSWYSQALQNFGICGWGIVTPQKRANVMIRKGLRSMAIKLLGVQAEIIWPRVTEKSSVIRMIRN